MSHTLFYTLSGKMIDLSNITASDIDLDDILRGLSSQIRYNGQTVMPFTVTHHTLALWEFAYYTEAPLSLRQALLLHDMPEYLTGDIVTGVKTFLQPAYGELEARIHTALLEFFSVFAPTATVNSVVKQLDHAIYVAEAALLQNRVVPDQVDIDTALTRAVIAVANLPVETAEVMLHDRIVSDLYAGSTPKGLIN